MILFGLCYITFAWALYMRLGPENACSAVIHTIDREFSTHDLILSYIFESDIALIHAIGWGQFHVWCMATEMLWLIYLIAC